MRIIKYTTHLDEDRKPKLVKEKASNYPEICGLNSPQKIVDMINAIYNATVLTEEYIKKLPEDKQEICNQLNRRTEFIVLRITYGMDSTKGNSSKQVGDNTKKQTLSGNNDSEDIIFEFDE